MTRYAVMARVTEGQTIRVPESMRLSGRVAAPLLQAEWLILEATGLPAWEPGQQPLWWDQQQFNAWAAERGVTRFYELTKSRSAL